MIMTVEPDYLSKLAIEVKELGANTLVTTLINRGCIFSALGHTKGLERALVKYPEVAEIVGVDVAAVVLKIEEYIKNNDEKIPMLVIMEMSALNSTFNGEISDVVSILKNL